MKNARAWLCSVALFTAFGLAGCGDDGRARPEPGIWLAITTLGPLGGEIHEHMVPIRVLNAVTGEERSFGPPEFYAALAWSPRGDRLAAFGIVVDGEEDGMRSFIRIWDAEGKVVGTAEFDGKDFREITQDIAWSPDGKRLLVHASGGLILLDAAAKRLGAAHATPLDDGGWSSSSGGRREIYWAPDSRHVAAEINGLLLVSDRDGKDGKEYDLPDAGLGEFHRARFMGWTSPTELKALVQGQRPDEEFRTLQFVGRLEPDRITWDKGAEIDLATLDPIFDPARQEQLKQLVAGKGPVASQHTADGGAMVYTLAEPNNGPGPQRSNTLAVEITTGSRSSM
jgi:dipeptidyl aminopeptidase/acylaminoacyl peptidase